MDTKVNVHEAKTYLSKRLPRVMNGGRIIIAWVGKPVALLSPLDAAPEPRIPGNDAGQVVITADFDTPCPSSNCESAARYPYLPVVEPGRAPAVDHNPGVHRRWRP